MILRVLAALSCVAVSIGILQAQQVTFDRIQHPEKEPRNWLSYSENQFNHRYSPLTQITPANAQDLELQWVWQSKSLEKFEATALVVDGVLYTVQGPPVQGVYEVVALDAATGRPFWTLEYKPQLQARTCCGRVSRGLAILGDTLYLGTIDAHLVAIDAKTGTILWDHAVEKVGDKPTEKYAITHAPVVVKHTIIVGVAGGDFGVRGFIAAFDAKTGQEVWRFYTVPATGEPGNETWSGDSWKSGGAAIWNSGAYDAEANLGIRHRQPRSSMGWTRAARRQPVQRQRRRARRRHRKVEVALSVHTTRRGRLRLHAGPGARRSAVAGPATKLMLWANRNGLAYVLDRLTGEFLLGRPFVKVNWMEGFDPKGRPIRVPGQVPTPKGSLLMPAQLGATNWPPPSFSPHTGLFYVAGWDNTGTLAVEGGGRPRPRVFRTALRWDKPP